MGAGGHRVYGVANFPWPLPVHSDALGMTMAVTIGETAVELTLPVLDHDDVLTPIGAASGHPLSAGETLFTPVKRSQTAISWGYKKRHDHCQVSKVLAAFELPDAPSTVETTSAMPAFQALGSAFESWFEIVGQWSAAWTDIPAADLGSQYGSAFEVATNDGRKAGSGAGSRQYSFGMPGMSRAELDAAFHHASKGERIPAEYKLLIDAKLAKVKQDWRQAVIDASTATEVALAAAIADHLRARDVTEEFIDTVVLTSGGLMGLYQLYKSLTKKDLTISRGRLSNEVASIRNLTVHAGQTPTIDEAGKLLTHARTLVSEARPLPRP